jgi:uncharacterized membrane protein YbhN (UPF0104 family)
MNPTARKWMFGTLVALLSVGLVVALLSQIKLADILRLSNRLTLPQLVTAFLLYSGANLFRALRLGSILGRRGFLSLTAISAIHSFLNHMLPFRSGELSLPFLLRAFLGRGLSSGALSLVVVRLYDMLSIAALMMVSLAMVRGELEPRLAGAIGYALVALAVGLAALFMALPAILSVTGKWLPACGSVLGGRGARWSAKLAGALHEMRRELATLTPRQRYVTLPITSLLAQLCIYGFFYYVMRVMGIDIGFCKNMLASSGEMITSLLPINMLGSFGTLEAGWAVGYAICGLPKADAIASGFVVHGLIIASGLIISLAGLACLFLLRRYQEVSGITGKGED